MLLPDEYFQVYGEKLAEIGEPKRAWDETEKEFNRCFSSTASNVVFRRFNSYRSFQASFRQYKKGGLPGHIEVVILLVWKI